MTHVARVEAERLTELVNFLSDRTLSDELAQLKAEHEYLVGLAPLKAGDRVVLDHRIDFTRAHGWAYSREILIPGATGTIEGVKFGRYGTPGWRATYRPEVAWTVRSHPLRNEEMRNYDCSRPAGENSVYLFRAEWLRPATADDSPLARPPDARCWEHGRNDCHLSEEKS